MFAFDFFVCEVFSSSRLTLGFADPKLSAAVSRTNAHFLCSLTQAHSRDRRQQAGRRAAAVCLKIHVRLCEIVSVRSVLGRADRAGALSSYPHCCGIERQAAGGTASSLIMPALFSNPPS